MTDERQQLGDRYERMDRPALVAIGEAIEQRGDGLFRPPDAAFVARALGVSEAESVRVLGNLVRAGYVDAEDAGDFDRDDWEVRALTTKGLRETGLWPADGRPYEALMASLSEAIRSAPDAETRGTLERLRDRLGEVGVGTVTSLVSAAALRLGGLA